MRYQITLDAGTTNTRAFLWEDGRILRARRKQEIGVSCTAADGDNHRLREAIRACVDGVLQDAGVKAGQVECILASGMVTSDMGLRELPHLTVPVELEQLAQGICRETFPSISSIPFLFIPGVKNRAQDDFESMDMMRGEEVEAMALLAGLDPIGDYLLVLPGSHTKFVSASQGQITGCLTTLTGELLSALTQHTILASTVGKQFATPQTYRKEMAELGYETARKHGLSRAAFAARILGQQAGKTQEEVASYLLGAVLEQDVRALKSSSSLGLTEHTQVILSGKEPFRQAFYDILQVDGGFTNLRLMEENAGMPLAAQGALSVYQRLNNSCQIWGTTN